jgi:alkaline phosphatase
MVEGSQPDWRSHANDPLPAVVAEVVDFDRAIGVALEYQQRHPRVVIVVVSDHETGGLALELAGAGKAARMVADYTTTGHTGQMIPIFASGPGAERFGGIQENWQIGQHLRALITRAP